ncbi:MAG: FHA domain-containing protein [Verrucomicrobiia bacterium]
MQITYSYNGAEQTIEIDKPTIVIGRPNRAVPPDLDLDPDNMVSRAHARISLRNGEYWIEDLASKYGTLVNGVIQKNRCRVNLGDRIRVGSTDLQIL